MSKLSKEQIKQFIQAYDIKTAEDIDDALKEIFGGTLQAILEAEMDHHLGYKKNDSENKDTSNRRNGHGKKTLRSSHGEVEIEVPRDRDAEFDPLIVKKRQRSMSRVEEQIIALYAKGVSTREIQDFLYEMYGMEVSPTLISDITDKIVPMIREWQSRPLCEVYAVLFMDAIHYKVRQDGQIKSKAAYMVIGINLDGIKDVLGIWIGESESSKFWLSVLNEIKNRGVRDILITSIDDLTGFSQAIAAAYPKTEVQKCIVHQIRNSVKHVSHKDMKEVTAGLKKIYTAPSEEAGLAELEMFEKEWERRHPYIAMSWRKNWGELSTFFKYPPEIRKIIYTTNIIESYHRQLRKVTKGKSVFPSDEALMKMLYLVTGDVTRKWTVRVRDWGSIIVQLSVFFPGRFELLPDN